MSSDSLKELSALLNDPEERKNIQVAIQAERCRRKFYSFVQEFWFHATKEQPVWNWHIEYLCNEIQVVMNRVFLRQPKLYDLVINIPPGMTKSTLCSVMLPIWAWTVDPRLRFLCGSYSYPLGLDLSVRSRDIFISDRYRDMYPEIIPKGDLKTKTYFGTSEGGSRFTTTVGGSVTGMHGNVQVIDDPIDPMGVLSMTEVKNVIEWSDGTMSSRKVDKLVTPVILVMQRLSVDDLTGHFLDQRKEGIRLICMPCDDSFPIRPKQLKKYYDMGGGLLDAKRLTRPVLKDLENTLGRFNFAAQYGQSVSRRSGHTFSINKFTIEDEVLDLIPMTVRCVRYWDKAGTQGGTGARTVGVRMHLLRNKRIVVSDVRMGRWRASDREIEISKTAFADGTDVEIWVEQEPGSGGLESAQTTVTNNHGYRVFLDRPVGDKIVRADPWSTQVNGGSVTLLRGIWNQELLDEHMYFPNSLLKDIVDACSGGYSALLGLNRKRKQIKVFS